MNKDVYVVVHEDKWGVRTEGSDRLCKLFDTQGAAIVYGRILAINNKSELRVQGRDGKFHKCNSYGNESRKHDINW